MMPPTTDHSGTALAPPLIPVNRAELATHLAVWLATAGSDQPWIIRDLWTRKGEPHDIAKRDAARAGLAAYLAGKVELARFQVTRPALEVKPGSYGGDRPG